MINKQLLCKLFEGFSIIRWNEYIRPIEYTEMDKQAMKAYMTFLFAKLELNKNPKTNLDFEYFAYASLFSLLKNIALSDIKAPVIKEIMKDNELKNSLNNVATSEYEDILYSYSSILDRYKKFLCSSDTEENNINFKIVRAAHKYSTILEFENLKMFNNFDSGKFKDDSIHILEQEINSGISNYNTLAGVSLLIETSGDTQRVIQMINKLRYQTRWSQTPRVPLTSVLGHSMFVACLMIFFSLDIGTSPKRLANNFFAGLFHDLPEALTRDIISPVKRATPELSENIEKIEMELCERELYNKLPYNLQNDFRFLLGDIKNNQNINEFTNRIREDGVVRPLREDEIATLAEDADVIDGKLVKVADDIAAFVEAERSISHGISSQHLRDGMASIKSKYTINQPIVNGIRVGRIIKEFI